jgi:hypothetical protein
MTLSRLSEPPIRPAAITVFSQRRAFRRSTNIARRWRHKSIWATRSGYFSHRGQKLTTDQADKLEARGNRYLYEINSRWTIDGTSRKNLGRYVNHSCLPNAETHRIGHKVVIRAIKNIKTGAEITYITAVII